MTPPISERIAAKRRIDENGCWVWLGSLTESGYPTLSVGNKTRRAHRVSYETFVGPIPDGLQLDHLCRVRHCVNPEHLEPVNGSENIRRSPIHPSVLSAAKTHCVHGHEYTVENTYLTKRGYRMCRECRQRVARNRSAAKAAAR